MFRVPKIEVFSKNMISINSNSSTDDVWKAVPFYIRDIAEKVFNSSDNITIVSITEWWMDQPKHIRVESMKELVTKLTKLENTIVTAVVCATTHEFPIKEYCLPGGVVSGKKIIPLDSVLQREGDILTECGFVLPDTIDVYETGSVYVYPNKLWTELNSER